MTPQVVVPVSDEDAMSPPAQSPPAVVEVLDISKRFGPTQALDGVSMTVRQGETHALVGRNGAGKSTLVSVLTGLHAPDAGQVRFAGRPAPPVSHRAAWQQLVACVYQHSKLVPTLSVAENLFLNRQPVRRGALSWRRMRVQARELLDGWGIDVDVERPAGDLAVGERQMVEIARSLSQGSRFVILDEPTAELEGHAVQRLFGKLRELGEAGVTFVYISHHLDEIFEICDQVTVLRDGRRVMEAPLAGIGKREVVGAMVGDDDAFARAMQERARSATRPDAPVVLDLDLPGVRLQVRAGETVGLAGLRGSGKGDVAEMIAGLRAPTGAIRVGGTLLHGGGVPEATAAGVGFVPADRHAQGYVPALGVAENVTLPVLDRLGRVGWLTPRRVEQEAAPLTQALQLVAASPRQPVSELSGGNQQKAVMARALSVAPRLLVLVHPTSGVDIASKTVLFDAVRRAAREGAAVLLVSDEFDELVVCDRVLVMFGGRLTHELPAAHDEARLVAAMEGVEVDVK